MNENTVNIRRMEEAFDLMRAKLAHVETKLDMLISHKPVPEPEPVENCTTCMNNRYGHHVVSALVIKCVIWTAQTHEALDIQDEYPSRMIGLVHHKTRCQHYQRVEGGKVND